MMVVKLTIVCGMHNVNLKGAPRLQAETCSDIVNGGTRRTGYYLFDMDDMYCPEDGRGSNAMTFACKTKWVVSMHLEA